MKPAVDYEAASVDTEAHRIVDKGYADNEKNQSKAREDKPRAVDGIVKPGDKTGIAQHRRNSGSVGKTF